MTKKSFFSPNIFIYLFNFIKFLNRSLIILINPTKKKGKKSNFKKYSNILPSLYSLFDEIIKSKLENNRLFLNF